MLTTARWRKVSAIMVAALTTGIVASIVQTQINLASLVALSAPVTPSIRWATTMEDVVRFGPVMAAIVAAALAPGLLAAEILARRTPARWRAAVMASAGVAGLLTTFLVRR